MPNNRSKPWEGRQTHGRITSVRDRRRVLILCEDEKSARLYFEGFQLDKRRVEVMHMGTGMSRTSYGSRLRALLGCQYDKADDQIYARLKSQQTTAMRHARRLEQHWIEMGGCDPESASPSTNIHKLVEFLNEFKDLDPADTD